MRPHRVGCAGFTLVETIATMTIVATLSAAASGLIWRATDAYAAASASGQLCSEASIALERITRELRAIPRDTGAAGLAPDIASVSASSIAWSTDWSLALSGDRLLLSVDGGEARTLAADVTAFTVQAHDESNTALGATLSGAACDAIRRIAVTLTLTRGGVSQTLRTRVFIRSVMSRAET